MAELPDASASQTQCDRKPSKSGRDEHKARTINGVSDEDIARISSTLAGVLASLEHDTKKALKEAESLLDSSTNRVKDDINRRTEEAMKSTKKWQIEMIAKVDDINQTERRDVQHKFASVLTDIREKSEQRKRCTDVADMKILRALTKQVAGIQRQLNNNNSAPDIRITGAIRMELGRLHHAGNYSSTRVILFV